MYERVQAHFCDSITARYYIFLTPYILFFTYISYHVFLLHIISSLRCIYVLPVKQMAKWPVKFPIFVLLFRKQDNYFILFNGLYDLLVHRLMLLPHQIHIFFQFCSSSDFFVFPLLSTDVNFKLYTANVLKDKT